MSRFVHILVLLNFALNVSADKNDWFSTIAGMQNLIDVENNFLSTLESYIERMQMSLDKIKTFKDIMRKDVIPAVSDPEVYIGHPINQYALIKRFALKWSRVGDLLDGYSRKGNETRAQYHDAIKMLPNGDDMIGAAEAIARVQSYYSLNMDDLTNGSVKDVTSPSLLNSKDCFRIGKSAYTNRRFELCEIWMNKSLNLYVEQKEITRDNILSYLKECKKEGVNQTMNINAFLEDKETNEQESSTVGGTTTEQTDNEHSRMITTIEELSELTDKARICNGEWSVPKHVERNLKCYYYTNNGHPRLVLKPIKLEELWNYPHIVRLYDIALESEMEVIKELARPMLLRANGASSDGFGKIKYRISNTAWLDDKDSLSVKRLSQRLADVTGLTGRSELLQVANYGMAGHYIAHFDAMTREEEDYVKSLKDQHTELSNITEDDLFDEESNVGSADNETVGSTTQQPDDRNKNYEYGNTGQRIATALVYLSEVQMGGSTAFFYPKIVAEPIKGSAVFWYNLYPSGALDKRTLHAACPVLIGNKWASNKWFRELGHEFVRKCGVLQNAENRIF
ncbi:prolyl 4-hydroxylase subunit alpha-1-like [Ciona intestinalis]